MHQLQLIGYWKTSLQDPYPFPQEVEIELASKVRGKLVHYLTAGACVQRCRGFSACRYGCGSNGSTEMSDGRWVWPEGLAHYVCEHRVGLPPEFVAHACRPDANVELPRPRLSHFKADDAAWIEWAKDFRRPNVSHALSAARERAARRVEVMLEAESDRLIKERGVGETTCLARACSRLALNEMVFCARCDAGSSLDLLAATADANALHELLVAAPWKLDT